MRMRSTLLPALTASALVAGAATALATPAAASAEVIEVSTAAQLKSALTAAAPGDTIHLADGTYTGNFKTSIAASSGSRITLTGSAKAVLTAGGGYGLHLNGASYWTVQGITVTGGQKGVVIDSAKGVVVDTVTVHGLDMEGVHFRNSSTDGTIKNSRIYDTGNDGRGMGEGVYVGTAAWNLRQERPHPDHRQHDRPGRRRRERRHQGGHNGRADRRQHVRRQRPDRSQLRRLVGRREGQ